MSKAVTPAGSEPRDDEDETEGLEQIPCQKKEDGSYHVGERGGPLGEGATPWDAFNAYARNVRAHREGKDVPTSGMPYCGTMKRPVNYIMVDAERLPDGSWHMAEVGGSIAGHGPTKEAARLNLAEVACYVGTEVED